VAGDAGEGLCRVPPAAGALQDVGLDVEDAQVVRTDGAGGLRVAAEQGQRLREAAEVGQGGCADHRRLGAVLGRDRGAERLGRQGNGALRGPEGPVAVGDQVVLVDAAGDAAVGRELAHGVVEAAQAVERDPEHFPSGRRARGESLGPLRGVERAASVVSSEVVGGPLQERRRLPAPSAARRAGHLLGQCPRRRPCPPSPVAAAGRRRVRARAPW